ncbi:MAG: YebC/PmpR family DNA-binding transcriptional regulator [Anaerolineae bacterium]|nr:MAG: YebC/PmpR family DNA-binding transcriptional regulator [Anaerolineae bacterium]
MSGHSKWSTIKRKKGANDAKRGQLFTRLAREIVLAAREGGGDPETNFRLRLAVDRARANNMPKDNIERAIKRGTGEDKSGAELEEITYEGYAPHGVALIISVVTDNRNRTVAEVRHVLNRYGGSMGESGSVAWQFNRSAYFAFPAEGKDQDEIFELAVEAGADDVKFEDDTIEIIGPVEAFKTIADALKEASIEPEEAGLKYLPTNEMELSVDDTLQVLRVIEALEDLDDVQEVFSNLSVSEEAMERMAA